MNLDSLIATVDGVAPEGQAGKPVSRHLKLLFRYRQWKCGIAVIEDAGLVELTINHVGQGDLAGAITVERNLRGHIQTTNQDQRCGDNEQAQSHGRIVVRMYVTLNNRLP